MRKNIRCIAAMGFAALTAAVLSIVSYASVTSIEVEVDTDGISGWTPGVSFFPDIELDDEDDGEVTLTVDDSDIANAMDPTRGVTINFAIDADEGVLDEDLKVTGNAIRFSYVDSVDEESASGRFLVYPFYQLTEPAPVIDYNDETVTWSAVDYAGKYEVVITYETEGGSEKTVHSKTEDTFKDISNYLKYADGGIGVSVRALATDEEYFLADIDYDDREASWESVSGVEKYKAVISYTNSRGEELKKTREITGTSFDVSSYISASDDGTITVKVRGLPSSDESKYYNIAPSEWADAEGSTLSADTSDYEVDYVWDLLGDYTSEIEGSFASASSSFSSSYRSGRLGSGTDSNWVRDTYKWQYLVDGMPFSGGWKQIGGYWYYFDADGYMHTGWLEEGGSHYYLTSRIGSDCGRMVTGSLEIGSKTYTFDESGACTNY